MRSQISFTIVYATGSVSRAMPLYGMATTNKQVPDSIVFNDSHNKTVIVIVKWTWLKDGKDGKINSWTDWLNFIEKI